LYIHIGENQIVPSNDVVMVFDYKGASSVIMEEFLTKQKENIITLTAGEIKSIVITDQNIYLSPLATSTIKKRAEFVFI